MNMMATTQYQSRWSSITNVAPHVAQPISLQYLHQINFYIYNIMIARNFLSIGRCFNHHQISLSKAVLLFLNLYFAVRYRAGKWTVVITIMPFLNSWRTAHLLTKVTWRMPLVDQELLILPEFTTRFSVGFVLLNVYFSV